MATATSTEPKKLTGRQALAIARAEIAVVATEKRLKQEKTARDEVRARYADLVPYGELKVAGWIIKRWRAGGGKSFSLGKYLEKHKLTKAMEPFVSDRPEHDRWVVASADGPEQP